MKIIRGNNVYVQLYDLGFLDSTDEKIPATIYQRRLSIPFISEDNGSIWHRFSLPEEVEYFRGLDFIVDYDDYEGLSLKGVEEKLMECSTEINQIVESFNGMGIDERRKHEDLLSSYEKLNYKFNSISTIYNLKRSHSRIHLPKELRRLKK